MALVKQLSRRALVIGPSNAEVSTNQTYVLHYTFSINGEVVSPIEKAFDGLKHLDSRANIHEVRVSARLAGTSQYRIKVISYDLSGLNPITHVNRVVTINIAKGVYNLVIDEAAIGQHRTIQCLITEEVAATPATDITVTVISDDLVPVQDVVNGHSIQNEAGATSPQEEALRFVGMDVSNVPGDRTVVAINSDKVSQVGDIVHSMLTEVQFQSLRGTEWVLADGQSVVGSVYETITSQSNIPDMRGGFLRGKNNGRSDGFENPDGDLALGTATQDGFKDHDHQGLDLTSPWYGPGLGAAGTSATKGWGDNTAGVTGSSSGGITETRPKNITINIFIKIN